MEEEPTCGRGLAQGTAVPVGLAAVAAGLAENLEIHTRALDLGDAAAVQERAAYERIARGLRDAAAKLRTAAAEMSSAVDLPMAAHDLAAVTTTEVLHAFERCVAAEDDLRRVLDERHVDNEQMLTAIRADVESPEAGMAMGSENS